MLFRAGRGRYIQYSHTQTHEIDGDTQALRGVIYHDDRKPLCRWLDNQRRYAVLEANKLQRAHPDTLRPADRLRRSRAAPLVAPLHCLFAKGLILDGVAGWRYKMERTYRKC